MDPKITQYLARNEVGDAELFVELFPHTYCYDPKAHKWYRWGEHYWREEGEGVVSAINEVVKVYQKEMSGAYGGARQELERRVTKLNTYQRRGNVLKLAASMLSNETEIKWDSHPWLLPCPSGVVDLRTGKVVPGTQEDYLRSFCPTKFVGLKAPCRRWEEFLLEIMDGDVEMVGYIQRLVGYALSGTSSEGIFPILWGRGRNGKGTMLEVLGKVLGDFATPVSSSLLVEQTYTRNSAAASPDLMKLQGKRLVWANEIDEGRKLSSALVKWLVGGDSITARQLYGAETTFRPTHTIFLLTNHKPVVDAEDYALWQRLHLIPFKLSFVERPDKPNERKRDMDLVRRFTKIEDQGILSWAVRGCLEWQEYGLLPPTTVTTAVQEYAEEEDYIKMFLEDETVVGGEGWTRALDVYTRYREWAKARGMVVFSMTKFGKDMFGKMAKRRRYSSNEYQVWMKVG